MLGKSHAEGAGLLDDDTLGIGDVEEVFGTVFGDVAEIGVRELCIE